MKRSSWKHLAGTLLAAGIAAVPVLAQNQQYPPPYPQQNPYPQQQGQYPPPAQYPPQGQYPQTGQYPVPSPYPEQAPPPLTAAQLAQLVGPVALYPDELLAQVLTASTFYNQIPDAATWAMEHRYLTGPALADAIREDALPFDASVQALLPFPQVLDYMARNPGWTQALGNAVLVNRAAVMDAVQHEREEAYSYGYLRSNAYVTVDRPYPDVIRIMSANPDLFYVPVYNPYVVYAPPRPGIFVGSVIHFGPAVRLGASFSPWGWGGVTFGWREHGIFIDHRPWERDWSNRRVYVEPYAYRPRHEDRHERHDWRAHEHDRH